MRLKNALRSWMNVKKELNGWAWFSAGNWVGCTKDRQQNSNGGGVGWMAQMHQISPMTWVPVWCYTEHYHCRKKKKRTY